MVEKTPELVLDGNPRQPLLDLLSDPSPLAHWDIYRMIELQDHLRAIWSELDDALYGSAED